MVTACLWSLSWLALGANVEGSCPAGSLLVLENCNSVVEGWTRSSVGHVALLFPDEGQLWVYEAAPGSVRRAVFADYQSELSALNRRRREPLRVKLYSPRDAYSEDELVAMRCYLDSQLGRRYSISNYARNRVGDGIHCAELASHTLNHSERFQINDCHRQTPGSLTQLVAEQYGSGADLTIPAPEPNEDWCTRTWQRWLGYGRWCNWSYGEAWSWCR